MYCGVSHEPRFGSFQIDQRATRGSVVPAWAGWTGCAPWAALTWSIAASAGVPVFGSGRTPPPPLAGEPPTVYCPE